MCTASEVCLDEVDRQANAEHVKECQIGSHVEYRVVELRAGRSTRFSGLPIDDQATCSDSSADINMLFIDASASNRPLESRPVKEAPSQSSNLPVSRDERLRHGASQEVPLVRQRCLLL